jgi:transposase
VHRRTVCEALASPIPPPRKQGPRPSPAPDPWKATIDKWLDDDRAAPKKQRHTARRIWQRLIDEHGAEVSESSVRHYVAVAKARRPIAPAEVMVPQTHPLGYEAEVDFGAVSFYLDGTLTSGWMFVMQLSASGKGYHRVYANQAQEAFIDGHDRAFAHFGACAALVHDPDEVALVSGRARATFICAQLRARTALGELCTMAGVVGVESLLRYARHVEGAPQSKAALRAAAAGS